MKDEFAALCYTAKETLKEKGFVVDSYIFDYRERDSKEQLSYSKKELLLSDSLSVYGDEAIQRKFNR